MDLQSGIDDQIDISVILPALNEEQTIGTCIAKIQRVFQETGMRGEIIVADSSTDQTAAIAQSLGARVVHPLEKGYGNAYLAGFREARGRYLVMGDADNTYDFYDIPRLLAPFRKGADFVIGTRFLGAIQKGSMDGLHRYIGNPLLTWMINVFFHTHFSDAHSGFRVISREGFDRLALKSGGMEFASEMLVMASKAHLEIAEVPIDYYPRVTPSKLHSFADGWRHIRFVLLMKPLPFIAIPGFVFSLAGLFLMAFFYLGGDTGSSHLHSVIFGAVLLLAGVQVVLSGFLMKTYSVIHGYEKKAGIIEFLMKYHSLEIFLLIGFFSVFTGGVIGLNIFLRWISTNFGILSEVPTAILSLVFIVIGIQIFLFAIFQSMMLLNENSSSPQVFSP